MTHLWDQLEGVSLAGEYELEQWLGNDATGAFYLTTFGTGRQQAVIKLVADDPQVAERQLAWWRHTARLAHPNLLALLASGRTETDAGSFLYAVFEYPDDNVGTALQRGPLTEAEMRDVLSAILDGLRYLHGQGMVHGSIDAKHIVAVGDRIQLASDSLREPEDSRRERAEDVRAFGAVIFELLTAELFAPGADLSRIPHPWRGMIEHCVEPDLDRRWSLEDIADRLHPKAPQLNAAAIAPDPVAVLPEKGQAAEPPRRSLALPLLIPALAAALVAVVLAVAHRSPVETPLQASTPSPATVAVERPAPAIIEPKPSPLTAAPRAAGAWRVIAYTFGAYKDAARKAQTINGKYPAFEAEVFTPKGKSHGPFLVAIGGRMTRAGAAALQRKATAQGLPRDTYIQNYSN